MAWTIRFETQAEKRLGKLAHPIQKRIMRYLHERIAKAKDPRQCGKPLARERAGLWRYRVEDYRILCELRNHELIVLVVDVGHRKDIYD